MRRRRGRSSSRRRRDNLQAGGERERNFLPTPILTNSTHPLSLSLSLPHSLTPLLPHSLPSSFLLRPSTNIPKVSEIKWVGQEECRDFVGAGLRGTDITDPNNDNDGDKISPWFGAIHDQLLHEWWSALKEGKEVKPDGIIHRLEGASGY